jgi:hypothetical protein
MEFIRMFKNVPETLFLESLSTDTKACICIRMKYKDFLCGFICNYNLEVVGVHVATKIEHSPIPVIHS